MMQVGFMMQKALGELFILKSTKPLPIIFKGGLFIVTHHLITYASGAVSLNTTSAPSATSLC